nr:hypothetical protein [Gammaproteobacteria bacterium]
MDLLRRKVTGPIQGEQQGIAQCTQPIDATFLLQPLEKRGEHAIDRRRFDPIEQVANVVVRGDLINAKQALGIVLPLRFLQRTLML